MSQPTRKNRLSPPFMHAFRSAFDQKDARQKLDLRDEAGERVIAPRRAAVRATISEQNLRREVGRDLEALVNAIALESTLDLEGHEKVKRSILNYGLPDIIHRTIDEAGVGEIEGEIAAALRAYEPRLVPGTVAVLRAGEDEKDALKVRFLVRADLLCTPVNVPVEFIADVELDSGGVVVKKA